MAGGGRYHFIDAWRGIAALAIVVSHTIFNGPLVVGLTKALPALFLTIAASGRAGVQIFFVISGFVIAHSLRDTVLTPRSIGTFIFRRQLRLDPPYWAVIFLTLGTYFLRDFVLRSYFPALDEQQLPSFEGLILNFFYLQNVTGNLQVVAVAWTLCIEIQFYLLFIALLAISKRVDSSGTRPVVTTVNWVLFVVTGVVSLYATTHDARLVIERPWFISHWAYFAAGVLCCWSMHDKIPGWVAPAFIGIFAGFAIYSPTLELVVGFTAALTVYLVGQAGHLSDWMSHGVFQYLGRISYSLYLINLLVVTTISRVANKLTGDNPLAACLWFVIAVMSCIAIAHAFHHYVEKPSVRLSSRFKRTSAARPAPVPLYDAVV